MINLETRKKILYITIALTIWNTIILCYLVTNKAHAAAWDTAGNVIGTNDFIGTTTGSNTVLKFKVGGSEIYRIQSDGMRFMQPITTIANTNGQWVLYHNSTTGCTGLYGQITKIFSICNNGFDFIGAPVNFKTNYTTYTQGGSYILTPTDYTVECIPCGEVIIPSAVGITGKHYSIINANTGELPIHTNTNQTIGNLDGQTVYSIPIGGSVVIVSNGSNWRIESKS